MRLFAALLTLTAVAGLTGCCNNAATPTQKARVATPLRHVVLFGWKEGTSPTTIKQIEQAFAALPSKIPTVIDFEWGTDVSVENLAQGYTHCFFVTFADEKGREAYLPHPAHQAFVKLAQPHMEQVLVIDYKPRK